MTDDEVMQLTEAQVLAVVIARFSDDALVLRRRIEKLTDQPSLGPVARTKLDAAAGGLTCVRAALNEALEEQRRD